MPSNNLNTILSKIQQYHPKYIDLKLDRMFRILNDLGNPHHSLPPQFIFLELMVKAQLLLS